MADRLSVRRHLYAGATDPHGLPPVRDDLAPKLRWAWAMARHLTRAEFAVETSFHQIVIATILRSVETFTAELQLLEHRQPVQAGMLARPLFEDLIVAHWVVWNRDDPDWLVERFFRHRDAIALHQERIERETGWSLGPKLPTGDQLKSRQNALVREFGPEAQNDWWDPGEEGKGNGRPIRVRGVCNILEDAANRGEMFKPRLAGGAEPLLRRLERAALKWFHQLLHHTAVGLPAQPMEEAPPRASPDPSDQVLFISGWMLAQQGLLLGDLYGWNSDTETFQEFFALWLAEGYGAGPQDLVYEDGSSWFDRG